MFDHYLRLRSKAEALFGEAIEHLGVLNEHFPPPSSLPAAELERIVKRDKEIA